jgi:hypothetical protein
MSIIPDLYGDDDDVEAERVLAGKIAEAVMTCIEQERAIVKARLAAAIWFVLMTEW